MKSGEMLSKPLPTWIGIFTLMVSLGSLCVSLLSWHSNIEGNRLANRAAIVFEVDKDTDDSHVGVSLHSTGRGTAQIRSISYSVDGHQAKDLDDALRIGKLDPQNNRGDAGDELSTPFDMASDQIVWPLDYHGTSDEEKERFVDFIEHHLITRLKYCSIDNHCATICYPTVACKITDT